MPDRRSAEAEGYRALYRTAAWRHLRQQAFTRDGYVCQLCGELCTGQGKDHPRSPVCDHINDHKGDPALFFDLDNLRTLHKQCHDKERRLIDSRGYHSAIGDDGWPMDPRHPANAGRAS